jgi:hypothetical protein
MCGLTLAGEGETYISGFKQNTDRLIVFTCANATGTRNWADREICTEHSEEFLI